MLRQLIYFVGLFMACVVLAVHSESSFADKPAKSYASFRDDSGKEVDLLWGRAPLDDFGSRTVAFDISGVRQVRQVPAPGIHPRGKTPLPPNVAGAIPAGQPMLLVRVLNVNSTKPVAPTIVELPNLADAKKYGTIRRLLIPADAVSPDFKVLLFAFHQGDALPQTSRNGDHTAVSVAAGGGQDRIEFAPGKSGKTGLTVLRDGKILAQLGREVVPLN